jgi:hypothetical protein
MSAYPHSPASISWNSPKPPVRRICMDCCSFNVTLHIPSVLKCDDCGGNNIIDYPTYLPIEQAGRYVKVLLDKEVKK